MKTERPQISDNIQSPEINSHTAMLQPPRSLEHYLLPHNRFSEFIGTPS